jgi:hypothetical protein
MTKESSGKLTLILSLVAAALALTAAAIEYIPGGEVRFGLVAAALFLVVYGVSAKYRRAR